MGYFAAAASAAVLVLAGTSTVEGGFTTTKDGTMMFRTAFHGVPTTLFTITGRHIRIRTLARRGSRILIPPPPLSFQPLPSPLFSLESLEVVVFLPLRAEPDAEEGGNLPACA